MKKTMGLVLVMALAVVMLMPMSSAFAAASVGSVLPAPESGWQRVDDPNTSIHYFGTWSAVTGDLNTYNGTGHVTTLTGATSNSIIFSFSGTKLRIIDLYFSNRVNNVNVDIDGTPYSYNPQNAANQYKVIVFEKLGLPAGPHKVTMTTSSTSGNFSLDAIDIDSSGSMLNDTTPPTVPANLKANPSNGTTVLTWDASTDASGVVTYDLYVDGVKKNGSPLTNPTYTATVSNNVTHTYYVIARDFYGNSSASSNTVTSYYDTISPMAPIGLAVNGATTLSGNMNQVLLTWTAVTDSDLAGYNVYSLPSTKLNQALVLETKYQVTSLAANQTYKFAVTAVDTSTNESLKSASVTYIFDTVPPDKPMNLSSTSGDGTITLSWAASTASDVVKYRVYDDGVLIRTVTSGTSTVFTGLANGVVHHYTVSSLDASGNESSISDALAAQAMVPLSPPNKPVISAINNLDSAVTISWTQQPNTQSYNVYVDGVKVNVVPITGTSFTVSNLQNGQSHSFAVTAVNSVGESVKSNAINGTPSSKALPYITYTYSLKDVATGVANWFSGYWMILAFVIAIPLSFAVGSRIKGLFA